MVKSIRSLPLLVGVLALGAASRAFAAADVKLGGVVFAQGVMNASPRNASGEDAKGRSSFDVSRIYLIGDAKFDEHWKAKIVVEGNTTVTGNGVFLKNAFIEYADLLGSGAGVQAGQLWTAWDALELGVWGRRYVLKEFSDLNGLLASADKGVGVLGRLPGGYGDYNAQVLNGEGITTTETTPGAKGRQKSYSAALSLAPLPNVEPLKPLRLNVFVQQEKQGLVSTVAGEGLLPSRERNRAFYGASYKTSQYHLMFTYYYAPTAAGTTLATSAHTRKQGYSAHGSYSDLPWGLGVFARYDRYDAGALTSYAPKTTALGGVEKRFNENVRLALVDMNVHSYDKGSTVAVNENTLGLFAEAKF